MNSFGVSIVQARMGSRLIVPFTPSLDEDIDFGTSAEPFHVQTFVGELAIKAFIEFVLSRLSLINVGSSLNNDNLDVMGNGCFRVLD